jgi:hypothetical protein
MAIEKWENSADKIALDAMLAPKRRRNNYLRFATPGSFTYLPTPGVKEIYVVGIGGGGGGGSGMRWAAGFLRMGGQGGTAGGWSDKTISAAQLNFSTGHVLTIGAGGIGGAAPTADNSYGADGTAGGTTTFGSFVMANGGLAGLGGNNTITMPSLLGGIGSVNGGTSSGNSAPGGAYVGQARPNGMAPGGGGYAGGVSAANAATGSGFGYSAGTGTVAIAANNGTNTAPGGNGGSATPRAPGDTRGGDGAGGGGTGSSNGSTKGGNGGNGTAGSGGGAGAGGLNGLTHGTGGNGGDGVIHIFERF